MTSWCLQCSLICRDDIMVFAMLTDLWRWHHGVCNNLSKWHHIVCLLTSRSTTPCLLASSMTSASYPMSVIISAICFGVRVFGSYFTSALSFIRPTLMCRMPGELKYTNKRHTIASAYNYYTLSIVLPGHNTIKGVIQLDWEEMLQFFFLGGGGGWGINGEKRGTWEW